MNPSDSLQLDENLARFLAAFDQGLAGGDGKAPTIELKPAQGRLTPDGSGRGPLPVGQGNEGSLHDLIPDSHRSEGRLQTPAEPIPTPAPIPGVHRIGRFELRKQLGKGGCGIVFLAFDPKLRREVALKIPRPELLMSPDAKRRLMREAEAAAEFDHPNLVPVYETGEIGPVCFIATAFCPGQTLAEWLEKQAFPVPVRQAARLVATLAEAVQHAHDRGVLHRDLKPNNVILQGVRSDPNANEGPPPGSCPLRGDYFVPRIVDFGLAKLPERGPSDTVTRQILGTPKYMAPEQAQGRRDDIGPQADVYALGVVLYELMAGRAPYDGATDVDVLRQSIEGNLTPPRHLRADTPRDLEAICLKAMAVTPAKRYRTAIDLADDIRRYLDGLPTLARPLNWVERAALWVRRNDQLFAFVVLITVCCVLFAVGAWNVYQTRQLKSARENDRLENVERMRADQQRAYSRHVRDSFLSWRAGDLPQMADSLANARVASGWSGDPPEFTLGYLTKLVGSGQVVMSCPAGAITALTVSPDGQRLASGHVDGTLAIWDLTTWAHVHSVKAAETEIKQIAFALNGTVVYALPQSKSGHEELLGWSVNRNGGLTPARGPHATFGKGVQSLVVTPDGSILFASGSNGSIARYDLAGANGNPIAHAEDGVAIVSMVVTGDGKYLLTANAKGVVKRWTGDLKPDPDFAEWQFSGIITALAADGSMPIVGFGSGVIVLPTGGEPQTIATSGPVHWLARTSKGEVVACGRPGRILIGGHDLATGDLGFVRAGALAPDGRTLFTGGEDGIIRSWNTSADLRQRGAMRTNRVAALGVHPAGGHFVVASDRHLTRNPDDGDGRVIEGGPRPLRVVQVLEDGAIRGVAFEGRTVGVWLLTGNMGTEQFRATVPDDRTAISAALTPDGRVLAVGDDMGRISCWSIADSDFLGSIESGVARPVNRVALSDDGRYVAAPTSVGVGVWGVADAAAHANLPADELAVFRFLPGTSRLATGGRGGVVRVWSLSGREEFAFFGHVGRVTSIGISSDARTLVSGGATGEVAFWDLRSGQELFAFRRHSTAVTAIEFAANGKYLITAGEGQIAVWDGRE